MATSGIITFSVSRNDLINSALRKCGVLDPEGGTANTTQLTVGAEALNIIVKAMAATGMPLLAIKKFDFAPTEGTVSYTVSSLTGLNLPIRIIKAMNRETATSSDIPMLIVDRDTYWNLGSKTSKGTPIQLYYDPQLTTTLATIYLFPTADATNVSKRRIHLWYHRPFEDFNAAADTPDFLQPWYSPIVWELAAVLAPEYGVPERKWNMIQAKALKELDNVLGMGMEEGSVKFMPDTLASSK